MAPRRSRDLAQTACRSNGAPAVAARRPAAATRWGCARFRRGPPVPQRAGGTRSHPGSGPPLPQVLHLLRHGTTEMNVHLGQVGKRPGTGRRWCVRVCARGSGSGIPGCRSERQRGSARPDPLPLLPPGAARVRRGRLCGPPAVGHAAHGRGGEGRARRGARHGPAVPAAGGDGGGSRGAKGRGRLVASFRTRPPPEAAAFGRGTLQRAPIRAGQ
jgi:hypothetical protein